jgi:ABC-type bacteriocin/lantibiotic exporter with double-glycine peptidase domain
MRVWQAGTHLTEQRGARVEDWSWRQTRRRLAMLLRLARPYPARTTLAGVTLLAYTVVALLPPYLAGLAVDRGIRTRDLDTLTLVVVAFVAAGVGALVLSGAQTYFTGWVGGGARARAPTSASASSATSSACLSASTSAIARARSSAASRTTSRRSTSS